MKCSTPSTTQTNIVAERILTEGMQVQLEKWKCKIESGHNRVGWKIGFNTIADQQRMKLASPIVGFLTSESVLCSGDTYKSYNAAKLFVEAEVAILIGKDVTSIDSKTNLGDFIDGYASAIEIVDVARTSHDITSILEDNVFHETVVFGEVKRNLSDLSAKDISGEVVVNGQVVERAEPSRYPDDLSEVVSVVADTLIKQGECLHAGDWIISGSITKPFEVFTGDQIEIAISPLGTLSINIDK